MESLQHSSLGSHWTKKNHKYLYKEGNRYIYPSDLKKMGSSRSVDENSATYKKQETEKKLNLAERLNNRAKQFNTKNRLDSREKEINARDVNNRLNEAKKAAERQRIDEQQKELLNRANRNRTQSATGRTAREVISDKGTKRVMYQDSHSNGRNTRARREVGIRTKADYDDRGFRKSDFYTNDSRTESRNHKSGTARDIINKKGTRRVEYEDDREGRKRRVTNKDYSKTVDRLTKNGAFKKKLWDMQKSIEKGKKASQQKKLQKEYEKTKKKIEKQAKKEREKQIPLSMRWKRDKKRFKRFFTKK